MMHLHSETLSIRLGRGPDLADITPALEDLVRRSAIREGVLSAVVLGSTGSLTTIGFEAGVVEDLKRAIAQLAPPGEVYEHDRAWGDGNGHSHVQAAILGPSLSLPIRDGRLALGTWQQAVAINHDTRPRDREILVTLIGDR